MQQPNPNGSRTGKIALTLCNIILLLAVIFFAMHYSANVRADQEQAARDTFCTTVETMKQLSIRYLEAEQTIAENWAAYMESRNMSVEEALDYVRSANTQTDRSAHIVDMDTFAARSSRLRSDGDEITTYQRFLTWDSTLFAENMRRMFNGQSAVLGKYLIRESQVNAISVGTRVYLRTEEGGLKPYLLLRVIPVESMKRNWLFPVEYRMAEIGMITTNGDYVIPSASMRSENFVEFVRAYSYADDYNGADAVLEKLQESDSGLLTLKNSRGEDCYWYYSHLDGYEGLDILGYIPCASLLGSHSNMNMVFLLCGTVLLLAVIDGAYILTINKRLRETAKLAEAASEAKTQFLSSMSHDIRTPLNAVLGMTELARSRVGDAAYVQDCLDKIALSGSHLLTLINDILEISKVESGKTTITPAPFAVEELVAGLESITRSQADARGLQFEVNVQPLPAPWLLGDKLRLSQVYLNLLNNAVKYTEPGGKVWLEVAERPAEKAVELVCTVRDTGLGMSTEFQSTMYDSFTRASDSRIDKTQGTGLGLAIVKRMVELMGGTIHCRSAVGEGTTFIVNIPLQPAEAAPAAAVRQPDGTVRSDLTGMQVLIAEDNDLNWEIIQTMLEDHGIRCTRAENGRECISRLENALPGTYELVLMDVQMPVLNGRDAARELRQSARQDLREIPIAAMTADAFAEDVQACMDAGMDAHLAKPVDLEKVLAALRTLRGTKHKSLV